MAHRLAWFQVHGDIPAGMCVLHRCDNRPCINVDHLFLGTLADNNADRASKGRNRDQWGERNSSAKLTSAQVEAICADPRMQKEIAVDYGIRQSQVSRIKNGVRWAHHTPPR